YVPFSDLNKVQKYIYFSRKRPKLYKLGGKLWQRTKDCASRGVLKVAEEILEVQAKRESLIGHKFSPDTDWQELVEKAFPYKETEGQIKATREVKDDMQKPRPMDRLLCGDVGYGKTEVALRAAFKAVMDNKQVVILVPTTILAEQHYATFKNRLKDFPVNIEMLSRFRKKASQKDIVKELKHSHVDIVIGTHRLLSDDIAFKDLGLVIIDEEQRFGVRHKEKLKKLRLIVDVLTLTATPIPRTLYLALMGGRDISTINTPPLERLPIETNIIEYNDYQVKEVIKKELDRKGQVYFVHNRIDSIDKIAAKLKKLLPEVKIEIGHGRMGENDLERTMLKFIKGRIDVLVCTTIIESGIDIPNVNTLIVNKAENFGLADLYQLRGRVGRFSKRAHAYFIVDKKNALTHDAQKRLDALRRFSELGSGFKIAMQDLELRGAGNLLGTQQHGYIGQVGFDLYCRLLHSAIEHLRK
ncbi:MAG: DEAD/DEAH box helicase, partial [Candidatus Omnitrophica bacterium]|nr:DEAD/DEAH box helicase [Candidatus Omnitrophota bacterium]